MKSTNSSDRPASTEGAADGKKHFNHGYRARHRSQQHDTAHDATDTSLAVTPAGVINHPLVPHGPAELILTNDALLNLVDHLKSVGLFAYDTEFIGEMSYVPRLCLIQVASTSRIGLIDPLMPDLDLQPFWELLADASIVKVTHAGEQDVEPVLRYLGRRPVNLFDTQICVGFVGMAYPVSLSKLVQEVLGVKLGKGLTFTHWDQRPLSNQQLRYAADDVRYLVAVREVITKKLEANGNTAFARAECDALCQTTVYQFDAQTQYLKVRGAGSLQPLGLAILRELTVWRDSAAKEADAPPRAFLKDDILIDLARNPARSVDKLSHVKGLPRPVEVEHGRQIVEATLKALASPPEHLPQMKQFEPTPTQRFNADALWAVVQCMASGMQIDPSLVSSRQEIIDLLRAIDAKSPTDDIGLLQGWRAGAIGSKMMKLFDGQGTLSLQYQKQQLRASTSDVG